MSACILCGCRLEVLNNSGTCRECRLLVANLLGLAIEERWRDYPDGVHVVSDRGRIARLLNVEGAHRYPRVSIAGQKRYVHHLVAEAWHGPRPDGQWALHTDDDPERPHADNLSWGTPKQNAADAKRNRINRSENTT
jgi:hypothetical protein